MRWRRWGLWVGVALLVFVVAFFLLRNSFLNWAVARAEDRLEKSYGLQLTFQSFQFSGFTEIAGEDVVVTSSLDTLLRASHIRVEASLLGYLFGKNPLKHLAIDSGSLNYVS